MNITLYLRHIAIGLLFAWFFGPMGFFLGVFISWISPFAARQMSLRGDIFDMSDDDSDNPYATDNARTEMMFKVFLDITFEVLGHVTKAKGVVTREDIAHAELLMERMHLKGAKRASAERSFTVGKDPEYPLRQRIRMLHSHYSREPSLLTFFVETQINAACIDGKLHPNELEILKTIAMQLQMDMVSFEHYILSVQANYAFRRQRQNRSSQQRHYSHQRQYSEYDYEEVLEQDELQNAYQVLDIKSDVSDDLVKRAYRKQMNEHHPDKLVSKGLPPEMMDMAKQRAQGLQAAYDIIKKKRGFK